LSNLINPASVVPIGFFSEKLPTCDIVLLAENPKCPDLGVQPPPIAYITLEISPLEHFENRLGDLQTKRNRVASGVRLYEELFSLKEYE